jgi:hypothetical protein
MWSTNTISFQITILRVGQWCDMMGSMDAREMRGMARKHAAEAIMRLVELMRTSSSDLTCLKAAKELLMKGYGVAVDSKTVESSAPALSQMPRDQRIELLREALSTEEMAEARDNGMIA